MKIEDHKKWMARFENLFVGAFFIQFVLVVTGAIALMNYVGFSEGLILLVFFGLLAYLMIRIIILCMIFSD